MRLVITIDDSEIASFSPDAKEALKIVCKNYALAVVKEAKIIEQSDRVGNSKEEVIASHVDEAKKKYRRPPTRKKWQIIIDVIVEILLLIIGIMFDKEQLWNNNIYFAAYIILIVTSIILLIIKYAKGK